jgi:hypothetical protein
LNLEISSFEEEAEEETLRSGSSGIPVLFLVTLHLYTLCSGDLASVAYFITSKFKPQIAVENVVVLCGALYLYLSLITDILFKFDQNV